MIFLKIDSTTVVRKGVNGIFLYSHFQYFLTDIDEIKYRSPRNVAERLGVQKVGK